MKNKFVFKQKLVACTLMVLSMFIFSNFSLNAQCWKSIAAGSAHSIAIKNDGTLWAWGRNDSGQLGIGIFNTYNDQPIQVGTDTNWDEIVSVGGNASYVSKTDNTLWGWGSYIGDGTWDDKNIPTFLGSFSDWKSIVTGYNFSMGLKSDNTLWTWGDDSNGQLGNASAGSSNTPAQVGIDNDWLTIGAGGSHALAIKMDGTLWVWGANDWGQLGIGSYTNKYSPFKLGIETIWQSVHGGEAHTLATKNDGTAWAWGIGTSGQIGDNANTTTPTPTFIGSSSDWANIQCSSNANFVIKTDGTLWGWGENSEGNFGNGTNTNESIPTQIGTESNWKNVAGKGWYHALATKLDNTLWVMGNNFYGQLGIGPMVNINVPTNIDCGSAVVSEIDDVNFYVNFYPNPSNGNIIVKLSDGQGSCKLMIHDLSGQVLYNEMINQQITEHHFTLNPGLYLISLDHNGKNTTEKMMIE